MIFTTYWWWPKPLRRPPYAQQRSTEEAGGGREVSWFEFKYGFQDCFDSNSKYDHHSDCRRAQGAIVCAFTTWKQMYQLRTLLVSVGSCAGLKHRGGAGGWLSHSHPGMNSCLATHTFWRGGSNPAIVAHWHLHRTGKLRLTPSPHNCIPTPNLHTCIPRQASTLASPHRAFTLASHT